MVMRMTVAMVGAPPLSLTCRACGLTWDVAPKPDGSMPIGSRCPKAAGGCGSFRRVPRGPAVRPRREAEFAQVLSEFSAWDPPSPRRGPYRTTEPCPACDEPLLASPRGTVRGCTGCGHRVTPPGVLAPYSRQEAAAGRTVRSQVDKDDAALALAERAAVLQAAIAATLGDDRLHPATRGRLEWYSAQITAAARAGRGGRVGELAERLSGERVRRLHWWNADAPDPAAITAGDDDDQDDDDDDDEVYDAELAGDAPGAIEAPRPVVLDLSAELAARGWKLRPDEDGQRLCHVVKHHSPAWPGGPASPYHCINRAVRVIAGGAVCGSCHDALLRPLGG
jgi:hypothetical protein